MLTSKNLALTHSSHRHPYLQVCLGLPALTLHLPDTLTKMWGTPAHQPVQREVCQQIQHPMGTPAHRLVQLEVFSKYNPPQYACQVWQKIQTVGLFQAASTRHTCCGLPYCSTFQCWAPHSCQSTDSWFLGPFPPQWLEVQISHSPTPSQGCLQPQWL